MFLRTQRSVVGGFLLLALAGCHLGRATKGDPAYLRDNHAGSAEFVVEQPARALFDRIAADASKCYTGGAVGMVMPVNAALFIPVTGAGRTVEAKFDDTSHSGTIRAFVDGNLYFPIFQMDVAATAAQTKITIYYAKDVGMHRASVVNLKAWLDGDDTACSFKAPKN
jgi:hypothetical protein